MKSIRHLEDKIPSLRYVVCPECSKSRLLKEINVDGSVEEVSDETVEVRDEKRFIDACGFCKNKYQQADEKFMKDNLKKIQRAMNSKDRGNVGEDFTLDI